MEGDTPQADRKAKAVDFFHKVAEGFKVQNSLLYVVSVNSLEGALAFIGTPEAQDFINAYLFKMVNTLLRQNPGSASLGTTERRSIDTSVILAMDILLQLPPHLFHRNLESLATLLDGSNLYYAGGTNAWGGAVAGFKKVRDELLQRFVAKDGFKRLYDAPKDETTGQSILWVSGSPEVLKSLLVALHDSFLDETFKNSFVEMTLSLIMSLTEEQLKKETVTENLKMIFYTLKRLCFNDINMFYKFWMDHTSKLLKSGTLVLRLFAWEQMQELMMEAVNTEPHVSSYSVQGASLAFVDGTYVHYGPNKDRSSLLYTKKATKEGESDLTLFRCKMRNGSHWWFLSQADKLDPGTDKDIDYYQHKSKLNEYSREAPLTDWEAAGKNTQISSSAPELTPLGYLYEDGYTEEMTLSNRLVKWSLDRKLIEQVFGSSIHRAIVGNSRSLLDFLAKRNAFTFDDVIVIWKSGLACDADTADEVLTMLAHVAMKLNDIVFAPLVDFVLECFKKDEGNANVVHRVALFLEKFNPVPINPIFNIAKLLDLVWVVYQSSAFSTLKNTDSVFKLLSSCINHTSGKAFAVQRITECVQRLPDLREERVFTKAMHLLEFLLSIQSLHTVINELGALSLPDKIVEEIKRFVQANRAKCTTPKEKKSYSIEISLRLKNIRLFYSASASVNISQDMLNALWELFKAQSLELESFFGFLYCGTQKVYHLHPMIPTREAQLDAFVSYICSEEVDWQNCGPAAFECFYWFFFELNLLGTPEISFQETGLRTLWNIFKRIPDEECTKQAVQLLLKAYESEDAFSPAPKNQLLPIVLEILTANEQALLTSGALTKEQSVSVIRCVDLLCSAITFSKAPLSTSSHATRGLMGRIQITVNYRKNLAQFGTMTRAINYTRAADGSTIIECHPMHSVQQLKEKLATSLRWEDPSNITIKDIDAKEFPESCPLQFATHLIDGAVIDCTYLQPSTYGSHNIVQPDSSLASTGTMGDQLAGNRLHFKCLLSFCDAISDSALSKKIWDLIMLLPTQIDCEADVKEAQDKGHWERLLGCNDAAFVAYNLQVIDSILQPAPEIADGASNSLAQQFKKTFISSGGFSYLLKVLITYSRSEAVSRKYATSAALHILRLLSSDLEESNDAESAKAMAELQENSGALVEKLLAVASDAAAEQESGVVEDALSTINDLVRDQAVAAQLIQNPQSRDLVVTVLKSESKKVRSLASEFAVQVGRRQPLVFSWLLADLGNIDPLLSADTFCALNTLLQHFCCEATDNIDFDSLAKLLSEKLLQYPGSHPDTKDNFALQGYLDLLGTLVAFRPTYVLQTELGKNFSRHFFEDYLFTMPVDDKDGNAEAPVCETQELRKTAFSALGSFLSVSRESFEDVISEVSRLMERAAPLLKGNWMNTIGNNVKKPDIVFTGLKNQGCTCYMNSCLQQLFMCKPFRDAVIATPLRESQRASILHRSDEELVGLDLQVLYNAPSTSQRSVSTVQETWHNIKVLSYDPATKKHKYKLLTCGMDGADLELNFRAKQIRLRLAPTEGEEPVSASQEAAFCVVEQLQRTFCFMKYSKKRFYDPLPLVEACKTLNLNFNVFQQNDASEFYDKLLDRIEMTTKSKDEATTIWANVFEKNVLGGRVLYQKIPLDCERYASNKSECGHWQGTKNESFLQIELQISSHDKIHDSLGDFFNTELMDGDNKISCEVCNEKKTTNRRACLGTLPNTMVLHLKRFDLDFSTFETVKLNNKMEFPLRINMLQYTKEGVEMEEKRAHEGELNENSPSPRVGGSKEAIHYEEGDAPLPVPDDYEYELQGVLIHAGVAQGGHYYSFARDPDNADKCYRLDDDDVTQFNFSPESIAYNCFGGTYQKENGIEENRTANALMLFYSKIRPSESAQVTEPNATDTIATMPCTEGDHAASDAPKTYVRMITGFDAFYKEVQESNTEHTLLRYMLDSDLHVFVRSAVHGLVQAKSEKAGVAGQSSTAEDDLAVRAIQFGCRFFLSVVLHCRERFEKDWIICLRNAFTVYPQTGLWFIQHLTASEVGKSASGWLSEYIDKCTESRAKSAFIQLIVAAATAISPIDANGLLPFIHQLAGGTLDGAAAASAGGVLATFMVAVHQRIFEVPRSFARNSDELFVLIRELAGIPCLRRTLMELQTISALSYFLLYDVKNLQNGPISPSILACFPDIANDAASKKKGLDFEVFTLSILEAMAAILDVPQLRKSPLLTERQNAWDIDELTPEARDAYTQIFKLYHHNGWMGEQEFVRYLSKAFGREVTIQPFRAQYERYTSPAPQNSLWIKLSGFLSFQLDRIALLGEKMAWSDLHNHGFRNDLKSVHDEELSLSAPIQATASATPNVPDSCMKCLEEISLYNNALGYHRQAITKGILSKICFNNEELSISLIRQVSMLKVQE